MDGKSYRIWSLSILGNFLHRVAELLTALPDRPLDTYEKAVVIEISESADTRGTEAERLNVYNGFLLAVHLDALFDTGLISFTDTGSIMLSSIIPASELRIFGIDTTTNLRWVDSHHIPFLSWHREKIFLP